MIETRPCETRIDLERSPDQLTGVRENIVEFICDQIAEAGANGAVVGLSGGVDSSLTVSLAVEALGASDVTGLIMPAGPTSAENRADAERLATNLGIDTELIELEPLVEFVLDRHPSARSDRVAVGNLRTRLRTTMNYLVANHEDRLVLGTGNRTELLIGYFTKYGDGAVDCLPIGILYKQQVRQLARSVGVPDHIVDKPASAELWAGQTDEDELGFGYDTVDAVLALHVDGPDPSVVSIQDATPTETILAYDTDEPLSIHETAALVGTDPAVVKQIRQRHIETAHKRRMPPSPEPIG